MFCESYTNRGNLSCFTANGPAKTASLSYGVATSWLDLTHRLI